MRAPALLALAAAATSLALGAAGCRGCLDIDEYTLVPGPPPDAGTGGASSSSSGTGGDDACQAPAGALGTILVASVVGADEAAAQDLCNLPPTPLGSVDLLAVEPGGGTCVARGSIAPIDVAAVAMRPQVMHRLDDRMVVSGGFSGALLLPVACAGGPNVIVQTPDASRRAFIAALRVSGTGFCTLWASTLWTDSTAYDFGFMRAHMGDDGEVVAAGALGPGTAFFEGGAAEGVRGGPFVARWKPDGALAAPPIGELAAVHVLDDVPYAVAAGLGRLDGDWWATGKLLHESPACHGCPGSSRVLDGVGACALPGAGGAGGAGGAAGAGGSGGAGGGGGARATGGAGGAVEDWLNAFLWRPGAVADSCSELQTYGADRGATDTQTGFDVASASNGCGRYWGGSAGRSAWPLGDGADTTLFDAGGATADAFLARQGATAACPGGGAPWSVRFVNADLDLDYPIAVERVSPKRCTPGVTSAMRAPGSTALTAVRCLGGTCDAPVPVPLAPAPGYRQLALLGARDDGALDWSLAVGPLAIFGGPLEQGAFDMATDGRDWIYVTFTSNGPLSMAGLSQFGCEPLAEGAGPGRWLVALQPQGFQGEAVCAWAQRFGQ